MTDLQDYELRREDREPYSEKPPPSRGWAIALALLTVAAAAAFYIGFGMRRVPAPVAIAPASATRASEPSRALGGEAEAVTVPPLADSDPVVRALVRALSNHQVVVAWLATDGLIRGFTVAVANIAEGASPAKQLRALRPTAPFLVVERRGTSSIDSRSYNRYTPLADAVASVDPAGA